MYNYNNNIGTQIKKISYIFKNIWFDCFVKLNIIALYFIIKIYSLKIKTVLQFIFTILILTFQLHVLLAKRNSFMRNIINTRRYKYVCRWLYILYVCTWPTQQSSNLFSWWIFIYYDVVILQSLKTLGKLTSRLQNLLPNADGV